jgi:hypothetical protein
VQTLEAGESQVMSMVDEFSSTQTRHTCDSTQLAFYTKNSIAADLYDTTIYREEKHIVNNEWKRK